jgi:D-3-phosphoglycerate dehydrogenase
MRVVLVTSRSFGNVVTVGNDLLRDAGFEVRRVGKEERPLDETKLVSIVHRESPEAIITGAEPMSEAVLAASDGLRMIMKHGVGVDNIDLGAAVSRGIAVANAPGTNTEAVADLAFGFILSLLRRICPANASTRSGSWERYIGHELGSMTIGIVGTGRIGAVVARRAHAFGASLLGYDVVEDEGLKSDCNLRYVSLDSLLREADVVTLHAPLMPQTRKMIGKAQLESMKPSALLVNCARGELVDEGSLYECLQAGGIAGAAVDVFATEPPRDSPLLKLDTVLATPHIGAYTYEAMEAMDRLCAETIAAVLLRKETPPNVLNAEALAARDGGA